MENIKIRLTKISDDKFDGEHPNGVNEGYVKEGAPIVYPFLVGDCLHIYGDDGRIFRSTKVTEIDGELYRTKNSTYKLEVLS